MVAIRAKFSPAVKLKIGGADLFRDCLDRRIACIYGQGNGFHAIFGTPCKLRSLFQRDIARARLEKHKSHVIGPRADGRFQGLYGPQPADLNRYVHDSRTI